MISRLAPSDDERRTGFLREIPAYAQLRGVQADPRGRPCLREVIAVNAEGAGLRKVEGALADGDIALASGLRQSQYSCTEFFELTGSGQGPRVGQIISTIETEDTPVDDVAGDGTCGAAVADSQVTADDGGRPAMRRVAR